MSRKYNTQPGRAFNSLTILSILVFISAVIIGGRLFYLQVIKYGFYAEAAAREHQGYTELPAKRGEILVQDYASGEQFIVAANTTLDLVYVDPKLISNKQLVGQKLSEILFDLEDEKVNDQERYENERKKFIRAGDYEAAEEVKLKTDEELQEFFYHEVMEKVNRDVRDTILLSNTMSLDILQVVSEKNLEGIEVVNESLFAYPDRIYNKRRVAVALSDYLEIPAPRLEEILQGENRYEIIKRKVDPEVSTLLKEAIQLDIEENPGNSNFIGVGFIQEYYRFFPEQSLASNILGYVDNEGDGQYGLEGSFDQKLKGVDGVFKAQKDSIGRQITVGESTIKPAQNGDSLVLTIDRTIQSEMEKIIKYGVESYRADAGQLIVLDPKTSKVIAMAHYPTFNPNAYSTAYDKMDIYFSDEEKEKLYPLNDEETYFYFYRNYDTNDRYEVFKFFDEDGNEVYQRYVNFVGAEAYQNKIVSSIYEPGSVFKSVTMSIALDDGDVTPYHKHFDSGPIAVDEFEIHNSTDEYFGWQTMTEVLERSSNTGMAYVAKKIGRNLFHSYMMKFGLDERTGIEFEYEESGKIEYFTDWADSELVTHAFGQGIAVTPLQMANAYNVLANGGVLMQPYIIDSVIDQKGNVTKTEPVAIRQVISEKTSQEITAMLVSAVENGVASNAKVPGYLVAGKTGTSQTYKHGKPLKGAGTTITSFAGYGPVENPQFVVLVKLDHPRASEWGSETAAPIFSMAAEFLFQYYNIPPER